MAVDIYGVSPPPNEIEGWANRRGRIGLDYGQANAKNAFDRGNALQNQAADYGSLTRQFVKMRTQLPGSFNSRGLLNSGIYKQGLQDYGQQRLQGFGDLARKYQQMLGGLSLQRQQGAQSQFADMADVNAAERQRRAEIAAQIRSL